jgi:hypothetical protein
LTKSVRGVSLGALTNYKNANLASFLLGLFYLLFPWFSSGLLNETTAIFGLVFLTVAIMRAKASNTVLGGLFQAFIGVLYLFALAGLVPISIVWFSALLLAAVFFIMELGYVKIGPVTKKADSFQVVPFTILTIGLLLSFLGYSTLFIINWQNILIALNYVAVFLFSLTSALQLAGWDIAGKKHTNTWLMFFAVAAIATAVAGTYQGTLFQWA